MGTTSLLTRGIPPLEELEKEEEDVKQNECSKCKRKCSQPKTPTNKA